MVHACACTEQQPGAGRARRSGERLGWPAGGARRVREHGRGEEGRRERGRKKKREKEKGNEKKEEGKEREREKEKEKERDPRWRPRPDVHARRSGVTRGTRANRETGR